MKERILIMKATVTAVTKAYDQEKNQFIFKPDEKGFKDQSIVFSGMQAGICYMGESYFDSAVTDELKAVKRCIGTLGNTHHSISDHVKVTILFEQISKLLAMILNSLQDYCTSEKSGRWTVMTGSSDIEQELYSKWMMILADKITRACPEINDKAAIKLGQENARYFLSVFTHSTTMSYTTSIRQWNYIMDWCKDYLDTHVTASPDSPSFHYEMELYGEISGLNTMLRSIEDLYIDELRDPNERHFSFLTRQTNDLMAYTTKEELGDMYKVIYYGSFVSLAQAQRHRTLKYFLQFDGVTMDFYIPSIIRDDQSLKNEWLHDMYQVKHLIPQGTLVKIVECGYIGDFFLKCKERLCGRAQLEIMQQTCDTLKKLYGSGEYTFQVKQELLKYINLVGDDHNIATKCILRHGCKEPCMHGAQGALSRLF
jgi:hypothetical protein